MCQLKKKPSSLFCLIDQALGSSVSVKSKTLDFLRDSLSIIYTYHRLNDSLIEIFVYDIHIHFGKDNGHVDVSVPLHKIIDMTMKSKIIFLPF